MCGRLRTGGGEVRAADRPRDRLEPNPPPERIDGSVWRSLDIHHKTGCSPVHTPPLNGLPSLTLHQRTDPHAQEPVRDGYTEKRACTPKVHRSATS